jgi:hypothetical protein
LVLALAVAGAILATTGTSPAQTQVYFQDFDTDSTANWVVNQAGNGVNVANFFFDYSTVGIPSAPHSVGGTTLGLKLTANLPPGSTFPAGLSVSPINFGITENFDMHFDLWLNFNGSGGASGNGSTQVGGAGYGTAGTTAQVAGIVADSVFIGATTDGGSSADYRVYASTQSGSPKSTGKKNHHGSALNFGAKWSSRNTCEQARNWLEARRECRREFFRVYRALGSNLESNTTKPGNRP